MTSRHASGSAPASRSRCTASAFPPTAASAQVAATICECRVKTFPAWRTRVLTRWLLCRAAWAKSLTASGARVSCTRARAMTARVRASVTVMWSWPADRAHVAALWACSGVVVAASLAMLPKADPVGGVTPDARVRG